MSKLRYNERELSLIKNTFAEREDILKAIRKSFLQLEVSDTEKSIIKAFTEDVHILLKKVFIPEIDGDAPLHQVVDLYTSVKIDDYAPEGAVLLLKAKKMMIDYIDQETKRLKVIDMNEDSSEYIKFKSLSALENKENESIFIDFIARNQIMQHIEIYLNEIKLLAGTKDETPEETITRLHKDSSK